MQQWIKEVARGKRGARDLTYEEARQAAEAIVTGNASPAQTAALLIAERIKTESPEELFAFTEALRNSSESLSLSRACKRGGHRFCRTLYRKTFFFSNHSRLPPSRRKRRSCVSPRQRCIAAQIWNERKRCPGQTRNPL